MQPVLFLSHGGGPMPLLNDPGHKGLIDSFNLIKEDLDKLAHKPSAIAYISAHWESDVVTITSAAKPKLYYDYYGFPDETYLIDYPVPGAPDIAQATAKLFSDANIDVRLDDTRGLDHGVFVPGLFIEPSATIPSFQISIAHSLDPASNIKMGEVLAKLREQNVMIVGSGFSFHNMRAFFSPITPEQEALNEGFESWLSDTVMLEDQAERIDRLLNWEKAPGARFCHPREEHLMPLLVCAAAANEKASKEWRFIAIGRHGSCYWWD